MFYFCLFGFISSRGIVLVWVLRDYITGVFICCCSFWFTLQDIIARLRYVFYFCLFGYLVLIFDVGEFGLNSGEAQAEGVGEMRVVLPSGIGLMLVVCDLLCQCFCSTVLSRIGFSMNRSEYASW